MKASSVSNLYTDNFTSHGFANSGQTLSAPGNVVVGTTFYALPANPTGAHLTAAQLTANTKNIQSADAGVDAVPGETQDSGVYSFNQYLTDDLKFFSEGFFSRRKFDQNRTASSATLSVPSSNPYYIAGIPGVAPGAAESVQYSLLNDLGPLHQQGGQKAGSVTLGVSLNLFGDWKIEPSVSYSQDNEQRYQSGLINNCALNGALGVSATGTGGHTLFNVPCTGTPALYDTNPATAFDPFAPGLTNPSTLARIYGFNNDRTEFDRYSAAIRLDGSVLNCPAAQSVWRLAPNISTIR